MKPDDETVQTSETDSKPAVAGTPPPEQACPSPPPPPPPPPLRGEIEQLLYNQALAEATKPLEPATVAIHSPDPEKEAAREALGKAYDEAIATDGPVGVKFAAAHKAFERTVLDMAGTAHFTAWLAERVKKGAIKDRLAEREKVKTGLNNASGTNEKARDAARDKAKALAERFAEWSSPVDKITALIASYADQIDKLNAAINNDQHRNSALTAFWFEVAPKHLQLAGKLDDAVAKAIKLVHDELGSYSDVQTQLKLGKDRGDHCLTVVATLASCRVPLKDKRKQVLADWKLATEDLADKEAKFKTDPDDVATFKQRWDKLKDGAWIGDVRKALELADG